MVFTQRKIRTKPLGRRYPLPGLILWVLFTLTSSFVYADFNVIGKLAPSDIFYKQLQDDIASYYRIAAENRTGAGTIAGGTQELPSLQIYAHITGREKSIFQLSAELNLPYDALAVINGLSPSDPIPKAKTILIPNMPGLFIPDEPATDLEYILSSSVRTGNKAMKVLIDTNGKKRLYSFLPGERFNKTEQAFYLRILFRFPVEKGRVTSLYGVRLSPITGDVHFHNGIDIAAEQGAGVLAARAGVVSDTGYSDVLGNYIVLRHNDGYESVYGHLQSVFIRLNETVYSGMIIGSVGSTGLSTGPHLHFEIRRKGEPKDPLNMLNSKR